MRARGRERGREKGSEGREGSGRQGGEVGGVEVTERGKGEEQTRRQKPE